MADSTAAARSSVTVVARVHTHMIAVADSCLAVARTVHHGRWTEVVAEQSPVVAFAFAASELAAASSAAASCLVTMTAYVEVDQASAADSLLVVVESHPFSAPARVPSD